MKWVIAVGIYFGVALLGNDVVAEQPTSFQDPLLDHLVGKWVLRGTLAGKPAVYDVQADWVLEHQYLHYRETSRDKKKDGQPAYMAEIYFAWDSTAHEYTCVFLDSFGELSSESFGHAKREPNQLPIKFVLHGTEGVFHSTLAYHEPDHSWTMNMDMEQQGKFTPFARTTLTRE